MILDSLLKTLVPKESNPAATCLKDIQQEWKQTHQSYERIKLNKLSTYESLKNQADPLKIELIHLMCQHLNQLYNKSTYHPSDYSLTELYKTLLSQLLQSGLALPEEVLHRIAQDFSQETAYGRHASQYPYHPLLTRLEGVFREKGLTPTIKQALQLLYIRNEGAYSVRDDKQLNARIDVMLSSQGRTIRLYHRGDAVGQAIENRMHRSNQPEQDWQRLLALLAEGKEKAIPTQKWLKSAAQETARWEPEELKCLLRELFEAAIDLLRQAHKQDRVSGIIYDQNEQLLRGAVWLTSLLQEKESLNALLELGILCFRKFPGVGPLLTRIGNACLYTFGSLPCQEGMAYLYRMKNRLKYASAIRLAEKYQRQLAQKSGKSADELEDMSFLDFGLDQNHQLEMPLGAYTVRLSITEDAKVETKWLNAEGREQKSVPAAVKAAFPTELKAFRLKVKDMQSLLSLQSQRMEGFYLQRRTWKYGEWKRDFLEHGLTSFLTKKLIWCFAKEDKKALAVQLSGQWLDVDEVPLNWIDDDTEVQLWHPIGFSAATVLQWRNQLEKWQITQPFKQAYREVYLLTDAELNTRSYSNRFAAHILRQHQFAALCKARGWHYTLQGQWDSHNNPYIDLPLWKLRVEYWVEADWQGAANDMGIFSYVATDQVRFYNHERLLNVEEVPALVFSELMRDVDLFVAVASVGNDPNWQDNGDDRMSRYWREYSFSDLSVSAQTRKEVLTRLLPRLKIGKVCELKNRFLIVKGSLRTYKIHLGSGNIMMEPNDQYLCIVPDRRTGNGTEKVFLPFEGDSMLSIILSKAFLLAEDTRITDPTITRQINQK